MEFLRSKRAREGNPGIGISRTDGGERLDRELPRFHNRCLLHARGALLFLLDKTEWLTITKRTPEQLNSARVAFAENENGVVISISLDSIAERVAHEKRLEFGNVRHSVLRLFCAAVHLIFSDQQLSAYVELSTAENGVKCVVGLSELGRQAGRAKLRDLFFKVIVRSGTWPLLESHVRVLCMALGAARWNRWILVMLCANNWSDGKLGAPSSFVALWTEFIKRIKLQKPARKGGNLVREYYSGLVENGASEGALKKVSCKWLLVSMTHGLPITGLEKLKMKDLVQGIIERGGDPSLVKTNPETCGGIRQFHACLIQVARRGSASKKWAAVFFLVKLHELGKGPGSDLSTASLAQTLIGVPLEIITGYVDGEGGPSPNAPELRGQRCNAAQATVCANLGELYRDIITVGEELHGTLAQCALSVAFWGELEPHEALADMRHMRKILDSVLKKVAFSLGSSKEIQALFSELAVTEKDGQGCLFPGLVPLPADRGPPSHYRPWQLAVQFDARKGNAQSSDMEDALTACVANSRNRMNTIDYPKFQSLFDAACTKSMQLAGLDESKGGVMFILAHYFGKDNLFTETAIGTRK